MAIIVTARTRTMLSLPCKAGDLVDGKKSSAIVSIVRQQQACTSNWIELYAYMLREWTTLLIFMTFDRHLLDRSYKKSHI